MIRAKTMKIWRKAVEGKPELEGWEMKIVAGARNRLGQCDHIKKLITLTGWYVDLNDEDEVTDTILHEVAHAVVGIGHGHDKKWKAEAKKLGATPKAKARGVKALPPRLVAVCHLCGQKHYRTRQPRVVRVCKCSKGMAVRPHLTYVPYKAAASKLSHDVEAVQGLLRSLEEAKNTGDRVRGRQIRAQLRRMGHKGGLRGARGSP